MSNKKYYTPEIEEFHVGFEYEIMTSYGWEPVKFPEIADTLSNPYSPPVLSCRVKHLDREDIESFGFTCNEKFTTKESKAKFFTFIKSNDDGNYLFRYIPSNHYCAIMMIGCITDNNGKNRLLHDTIFNLFAGKIKNKSELARVLKQVGVI